MKLSNLVVKEIKIPFKVSFKHSSAERSTTQSIWVEATSEKGTIGYGEGCPREYVTNESIDTAITFFNNNKLSVLKDINDLKSLRLWCNNHKEEIDKNPAAWCAIELALLDLIAEEELCSVEQLLGLPNIDQPFHYSAILGDADIAVFVKQLNQYASMGFTDFKIKISGALEKDQQKFDLLREQGDKKFRVRLDANNLWRHDEEVTKYLSQIKYPLFAIEEPLKSGNYAGFEKVIHGNNIKLILDESFLTVEDFQKINRSASGWIINLRISKMGGLLRSLTIAEKARRLGIHIIIGAQVGETSLLSRAALVVANSYRDILIAQEGAFGTLLLQTDVCHLPVMFGEKGLLNFIPDDGYGFQLRMVSNLEIFL